jgi:hypothetical protein
VLTDDEGRTVSAAPAQDVDLLLAVAIERASAAGQWGVVASLAAELAARRLATVRPA